LSTDSRFETSQTNVVEDLNVLDKQKDEPVGTPEEGGESNSCILELKRKLNLAQKRTRKLNEEVEMLKNQVETVFNEDQIDFFKRGTMIGRQWKTDTIKKSLKLYLSCGTTGYEELRKQNYPLPCIRTLQKRIEIFKFRLEFYTIYFLF
jgi:hypothetical protein